MPRTILIRVLILGAILVSAAFLLGYFALPWTHVTVNEGRTIGPAAAWSTQLSTSLDAARKDMKEPVLVAALAQPIGAPPDRLLEEQAFEVQFLFAADTPQRTYLYIDLNDSEPQQTVRKNTDMGFGPQYDVRPNLDEYANRLEMVKISPRDAYNMTLSDARTRLGDNAPNYLVNIYLHLLPELLSISDSTPVWSIYYSRPTNNDSSSSWRVDYLINAETGTVIQSWDDMERPTQTPSPLIP